MPEVNCVTHGERLAAGYCSRCQMPYCADCLDVEMGQPLCLSCKKKFSQAAPPSLAPSPSAGSPLNFKGRGLDDDLLGLLGAPAPSAAPKADPPKAPPPKFEMPDPSQSPPPSITPPPKLTPSPSSPSKIDFPLPPLEKPPSLAPPVLKQAPMGSNKPSLDLNSLTAGAPSSLPPFPKSPAVPDLPASADPLPLTPDKVAGLPIAPAKKKNKVYSLAKIWVKFLVRRSYEMFDPLAQKLKVPTYVFLAVVFTLLGGAVVGIGAYLDRPTVAMAETVPPIHFIQVNSGQISEMDVTTYTDLQNQVQTMGFSPLMQMTIPQLPSPNYFDVGIKDNIGTYSEILKTPGQITPHLSFVTLFTNGVWYSTNGWEGKDQQMEYLVSEFFPKDTPDQLYVKHVQGVEKLKQDRDWQVQAMNQNRYMAALSDHLRWFLAKKDIQGYKADFQLWH